jgi:hypothetical protein
LWADWFASNLLPRPMSALRFVTITLWVVPLALQYAIAAAMLRRRLVRMFPIFFGYTAVVVSRETALFFLRNPGKSYAYVYLWGEALAVLLSVGAIAEALRHSMPSHPFLRKTLGWVWILGFVATAMALIALLILFSTPARGRDLGLERIILLERSVRLLQASVLIVVIALMSRLGLEWHHYIVGIVVGFGVYSALELVLLELRGHLHLISSVTYSLLQSSGYNLAAVIWAFYFLRPWRLDAVPHLPAGDLEQWNEALTTQIRLWHRRS